MVHYVRDHTSLVGEEMTIAEQNELDEEKYAEQVRKYKEIVK